MQIRHSDGLAPAQSDRRINVLINYPDLHDESDGGDAAS